MRFAAFALFVFLGANITASQLIPPLHEQLLAGNRNAAILFLRGIRGTENYNAYADRFETIHNDWFERELNADVYARGNLIEKLERVASQYPQSRDALYYLSVLHVEQGNGAAAAEYLNRAIIIDPQVVEYMNPSL